MTDPTELRRLAEAATPGPWLVDKKYFAFVTDANGNDVAQAESLVQVKDVEQSVLDAAYIAAANPSAVLALLDRLDLALIAIERCKATMEAMHPATGMPDEDVSRLYNAMMEALGDD